MPESTYHKAIVGLGNPGIQYHLTRHNLGFLAIDRYLSRLRDFSEKSLNFSHAFLAADHIIAKPQTFMNRSGIAIAEIAVDYQIPLHNMLIVTDDYSLPFRSIRIRAKGGAGGHNGLKSIIEKTGSDEFPRLRLGIWDEVQRPELSDYVLELFSDEQEIRLNKFLDRAADVIEAFVQDDVDTVMSKFNA
jgi:PTH1 family peptidyl-tRNA hydrolase